MQCGRSLRASHFACSKIGLTSDPIQSRRSYFKQNFKCFDVLRKVASRSC